MNNVISPCVDCEDKLEHYACINKCDKPRLYAMGFGEAGKALPDHCLSAVLHKESSVEIALPYGGTCNSREDGARPRDGGCKRKRKSSNRRKHHHKCAHEECDAFVYRESLYCRTHKHFKPVQPRINCKWPHGCNRTTTIESSEPYCQMHRNLMRNRRKHGWSESAVFDPPKATGRSTIRN